MDNAIHHSFDTSEIKMELVVHKDNVQVQLYDFNKFVEDKLSKEKSVNPFLEFTKEVWEFESISFGYRHNILFPSILAWSCVTSNISKTLRSNDKQAIKTYLIDNFASIDLSFLKTEKDYINAGKSITHLCWCPNVSTYNQILACLVTMDKNQPGRVLKENDDNILNVIQIWDYGSFKDTPIKPTLKYSLLFEWENITRMLWISPDLVYMNKVRSYPFKNNLVESPQILYGHLLFACTDGFLRIVPMANFSDHQLQVFNDNQQTVKCEPPVLTIDLNNAMILGISTCYLNDMGTRYGYPTCVDWRPTFPSKLVVGYSTGFVAVYDLSNVHHTRYDFEHQYLGAIYTRKIGKSAVTSVKFLMNWHEFQVTVAPNAEGVTSFTIDMTSRQMSIDRFRTKGEILRTTLWLARGGLLVSLSDCMNKVIIQSAVTRKIVTMMICGMTCASFCECMNSLVVATESGSLMSISLSHPDIAQALLDPDDSVDLSHVPMDIRYYRYASETLIDCNRKSDLLQLYDNRTSITYPTIKTLAINPNIGATGWLVVGLDCGLVHLVRFAMQDIPYICESLFDNIEVEEPESVESSASLTKPRKSLNVRNVTKNSNFDKVKPRQAKLNSSRSDDITNMDPLDRILYPDSCNAKSARTQVRKKTFKINVGSAKKKNAQSKSKNLIDDSDIFQMTSNDSDDISSSEENVEQKSIYMPIANEFSNDSDSGDSNITDRMCDPQYLNEFVNETLITNHDTRKQPLTDNLKTEKETDQSFYLNDNEHRLGEQSESLPDGSVSVKSENRDDSVIEESQMHGSVNGREPMADPIAIDTQTEPRYLPESILEYDRTESPKITHTMRNPINPSEDLSSSIIGSSITNDNMDNPITYPRLNNAIEDSIIDTISDLAIKDNVDTSSNNAVSADAINYINMDSPGTSVIDSLSNTSNIDLLTNNTSIAPPISSISSHTHIETSARDTPLDQSIHNTNMQPLIKGEIMEPTIDDIVVEPPINDTIVGPSSSDTFVQPSINDICLEPKDGSINDKILDPSISDTVMEPLINDVVMESSIKATVTEPSFYDTIEPLINDTIVDSSITNTVMDQSMNYTNVQSSINDTFMELSIKDTIMVPQINDTINDQSINDTIIEPSINDNILEPPINDSIKNQSSNYTIIDQSNITETMYSSINNNIIDLSVNDAIMKPPIDGSIKSQSVNKIIIQPSIYDPVMESLINNSDKEELINETLMGQTINDTIVEPSMNDSIKDESISDAIMEPSLNDIILETSINDTSKEPSLSDIIIEPSISDTIQDQSINDTIKDQTTNETITEILINDIIIDSSLNDTVKDQSVNETIIKPPVNDTTEDQSINDRIIEPSINDVIKDQLISETNMKSSSNDTTMEISISDTIIEQPINDTIMETLGNDIIIEPLINDIVKRTINDTIKGKSINETVMDPSINDTIMETAINDKNKNQSSNKTIMEASIDVTINDKLINATIIAQSIINETVDSSIDNNVMDSSARDTNMNSAFYNPLFNISLIHSGTCDIIIDPSINDTILTSFESDKSFDKSDINIINDLSINNTNNGILTPSISDSPNLNDHVDNNIVSLENTMGVNIGLSEEKSHILVESSSDPNFTSPNLIKDLSEEFSSGFDAKIDVIKVDNEITHKLVAYSSDESDGYNEEVICQETKGDVADDGVIDLGANSNVTSLVEPVFKEESIDNDINEIKQKPSRLDQDEISKTEVKESCSEDVDMRNRVNESPIGVSAIFASLIELVKDDSQVSNDVSELEPVNSATIRISYPHTVENICEAIISSPPVIINYEANTTETLNSQDNRKDNDSCENTSKNIESTDISQNTNKDSSDKIQIIFDDSDLDVVYGDSEFRSESKTVYDANPRCDYSINLADNDFSDDDIAVVEGEECGPVVNMGEKMSVKSLAKQNIFSQKSCGNVFQFLNKMQDNLLFEEKQRESARCSQITDFSSNTGQETDNSVSDIFYSELQSEKDEHTAEEPNRIPEIALPIVECNLINEEIGKSEDLSTFTSLDTDSEKIREKNCDIIISLEQSDIGQGSKEIMKVSDCHSTESPCGEYIDLEKEVNYERNDNTLSLKNDNEEKNLNCDASVNSETNDIEIKQQSLNIDILKNDHETLNVEANVLIMEQNSQTNLVDTKIGQGICADQEALCNVIVDDTDKATQETDIIVSDDNIGDCVAITTIVSQSVISESYENPNGFSQLDNELNTQSVENSSELTEDVMVKALHIESVVKVEDMPIHSLELSSPKELEISYHEESSLNSEEQTNKGIPLLQNNKNIFESITMNDECIYPEVTKDDSLIDSINKETTTNIQNNDSIIKELKVESNLFVCLERKEFSIDVPYSTSTSQHECELPSIYPILSIERNIEYLKEIDHSGLPPNSEDIESPSKRKRGTPEKLINYEILKSKDQITESPTKRMIKLSPKVSQLAKVDSDNTMSKTEDGENLIITGNILAETPMPISPKSFTNSKNIQEISPQGESSVISSRRSSRLSNLPILIPKIEGNDSESMTKELDETSPETTLNTENDVENIINSIKISPETKQLVSPKLFTDSMGDSNDLKSDVKNESSIISQKRSARLSNKEFITKGDGKIIQGTEEAWENVICSTNKQTVVKCGSSVIPQKRSARLSSSTVSILKSTDDNTETTIKGQLKVLPKEKVDGDTNKPSQCADAQNKAIETQQTVSAPSLKRSSRLSGQAAVKEEVKSPINNSSDIHKTSREVIPEKNIPIRKRRLETSESFLDMRKKVKPEQQSISEQCKNKKTSQIAEIPEKIVKSVMKEPHSEESSKSQMSMMTTKTTSDRLVGNKMSTEFDIVKSTKTMQHSNPIQISPKLILEKYKHQGHDNQTFNKPKLRTINQYNSQFSKRQSTEREFSDPDIDIDGGEQPCDKKVIGDDTVTKKVIDTVDDKVILKRKHIDSEQEVRTRTSSRLSMKCASSSNSGDSDVKLVNSSQLKTLASEEAQQSNSDCLTDTSTDLSNSMSQVPLKKRKTAIEANISLSNSMKSEKSLHSAKAHSKPSGNWWHNRLIKIEWQDKKYKGGEQTIRGNLLETMPKKDETILVKWPRSNSKLFYPAIVKEILPKDE